MSAGLKAMVDTLARSRPGSRAAGAAKAQLEHAIGVTLGREGIRAVEARVAAMRKAGAAFALAEKGAGRRTWALDLGGGREIRLAIARNRFYRFARVQLLAAPPVPTPRERRVHALQEAFYARYNAAARKARPTGGDRLAVLVGDFEGGVNNGGFDTYLSNKGLRTARAAARALRAIGAKRTAVMLENAMASGATGTQRAALDARFFARPEDLAQMAARHLRLVVPA